MQCNFSHKSPPSGATVFHMRKHILFSVSHTIVCILIHISSLKSVPENKSSPVGVCNVWHTATGEFHMLALARMF